MAFQTAIFYLREFFFPLGCGGCGEALFTQKDAYFGLCENCRAHVLSALNQEKRCDFCGKPLISEKDSCLSCRQNGAPETGIFNKQFIKLKTLFPYTGNFRQILGAYKFGKSLGVGNFLASCLNQTIQDFCLSEGLNSDYEPPGIVPVPPRPGKIKKQGWDQIEYLVKIFSRCQKTPEKQKTAFFSVHRCLKRLPSRTQKELNRKERETNLKGRIICIKSPPKTAILFDDVITTGATMNACASALLEGGAEKVYGICLFYD